MDGIGDRPVDFSRKGVEKIGTSIVSTDPDRLVDPATCCEEDGWVCCGVWKEAEAALSASLLPAVAG